MFLFIFDLKMDYRIDAIMLITLLSKNYQMDGLQLDVSQYIIKND